MPPTCSSVITHRSMLVRCWLTPLIVALVLATSGCAPDIQRWIVQTRNHQGDVALEHGNDPDASVAYQLALRVDPHNVHARRGLVLVQARIAQKLFAASRFDEARVALAVADKYAPGDERIAGLRSQIEQAEIKRDIVVSNYPAYKETGAALERTLATLRVQSGQIARSLKRFDYTYDSNDLTEAIRQSYDLNDQIAHMINRMIAYRQLVDSGVPESAESAALAPPASLLPLP
jgi:hypothetical protein